MCNTLNCLCLDIVDPVGDVRNFVTLFNNKYGTGHPAFFSASYSQVS